MEQFTKELRLGDVIDDHCIKCRRVTNHSIVSLVDGKAAKVRCRTCYHDHDYRNEQAPPSKKELKKMELFKEVLAGVAPGSEEATDGLPGELPEELSEETDEILAVPDLSDEELLSGAEAPLREDAHDAEPPSIEEPPVAPVKKGKARVKRA